jgi:ribonuclease Z
MLAVTILGNNSALPAYNRHPTAQIVTVNEQLLLIDCGEGTQMQMSHYKIRRSKINHILISHLHGDHYFGLIGLITSMGLLGRENDLHIYAPSSLQPIIEMQLAVAATTLPFQLHFHPILKEGLLIDEKKFSVDCFATQHRIECWGFIVKEKKNLRKINKEKIIEFNIPAAFYERLKNGDDYEDKNGNIIKNEWVTIANTPVKSYAYSADTIFDEQLIEKVKNVTALYHETTYLKDLHERATSRYHSTTEQAAMIASKANAGKLLIGHFSSKYEALEKFLEETIAIFPNTELALEGVCYKI